MEYIRRSLCIFGLFIAISLVFFCTSAQAVYYGITGPSGQVVNGQEYEWTITVDTQGQALTDGAAAVTFDTQYLQYVSTTPGDFFNSVSASPSATVVTLTGTNLSAKSGTGTFAKVKFKLIASGPGSTELCTVAPVTTPTPTPPVATATPVPTTPPAVVTNTPTPTAIVQTGFGGQWTFGIVAFSLIALGVIGVLVL
ncbi:MAG: cohesin domain-containing protein [Candidatus Roizmanbacteria bacterium]|nr:cohesin domain-containing protein [Candidatus Roizmanbacteria bacterium]